MWPVVVIVLVRSQKVSTSIWVAQLIKKLLVIQAMDIAFSTLTLFASFDLVLQGFLGRGIDLGLATGKQIPIEERDAKEVSHGLGRQTIADGTDIYNPAFDVTPAELVTAIITENGVAKAPYEESLRRLCKKEAAHPVTSAIV